jgi:hypothetical protein
MNGSRLTAHGSRLMLLALLLLASISSHSRGQWTIDFVVDEAQATQELGAERVPYMLKALARVKSDLEQILSASTGNVSINLEWTDPANPAAIADATSSAFFSQTPTLARDKLTGKAAADDEPQSELNLYDAYPNPTVPFLFDTSTVRSANFVSIPRSLNQHPLFGAFGAGSDGTIRVRPPSSTLQWQFWKGKLKSSHEMFDVVMTHEALHILGFTSAAENSTVPNHLFTMDVLRFADGSLPNNAAQFQTFTRELRPTVEATMVTRLSSSSGTYKMSRGTRTGGDGNQAQHWRSYSRLDPPNPIGVMDPAATTAVLYNALGNMLMAKADAEALDLIGWNVNPNAHNFAAAEPLQLLAPLASAAVRTNRGLTFEWDTNRSTPDGWALFIYQGTEVLDDFPFRVYDDLTVKSHTIPAAQSLPPGQYVWYVVGDIGFGYQTSEERLLTILCLADFDGSGFVDTDDYSSFIDAYLAGDPEADMDNTGFVDSDDFDTFVLAFEAGC